MLALLRNGRFVALLLLTAVPSKLLLSGALFFLVPLVASQLGANQAEVGRLIILYGVAGFVLSSPFARLADRWSIHGAAVGSAASWRGRHDPVAVRSRDALRNDRWFVALGVGAATEHFAATGLRRAGLRSAGERRGSGSGRRLIAWRSGWAARSVRSLPRD